MKVIVHIISSDNWSGRHVEEIKTYRTVRGAEAFCKRFNARNNLPETPAYYEFAQVISIDGLPISFY